MQTQTQTRINQADALREDAVRYDQRGDVTMAEQSLRQADDFDPRVPAGGGPGVARICADLYAAAKSRDLRAQRAAFVDA